jgi:hypothetical protein
VVRQDCKGSCVCSGAFCIELIRDHGDESLGWVELAGQANGGVMYFHDKQTNRRVMLIGLLFCSAFVFVSFFVRPQPGNDRVLVKADRLTLTAGKSPLAN